MIPGGSANLHGPAVFILESSSDINDLQITSSFNRTIHTFFIEAKDCQTMARVVTTLIQSHSKLAHKSILQLLFQRAAQILINIKHAELT